MICSNLANVSLFLSSSQAAVTDTTSGLMLFSCSSNCSLNKMAWSRGINRFTPDIWKKKRGAYETIPCLLLQWVCDSVCVRARVWEHAVVGKCSEFIHYRNLQLNKAPLFNSMRTFCVSNLLTNHLRKRTISTLFTTHTDTTTSLWLVSFKSADNSTITILWKRSVYFFSCAFLCTCICKFPYHYSKLFRLSQVIVFILHFCQDTQLVWSWQLLDQVLSDNERNLYRKTLTWRSLKMLDFYLLCHKDLNMTSG